MDWRENIIDLIRQTPTGLSRGQIHDQLNFQIHEKTLQRRLNQLIVEQRIQRIGQRKGARYLPLITHGLDVAEPSTPAYSSEAKDSLAFLRTPAYSRPPVTYRRGWLDDYQPNETFYLPKQTRDGLLAEGRRFDQSLAAGTYAHEIAQKLLVDLSYNSSRLEGNTYSQSDTRELVKNGITAKGKADTESAMILNHKEAIEFLIENGSDADLSSLMIKNLHQLLSQDLLSNPSACGQIRSIPVRISQSAYLPLDNRHLLSELLELVLIKARQIEHPIEQSFFLLIHLSYLQAFEDVNKRTSRLACNLPLIKANLCPLSFTDLEPKDYTAALLAVYELQDVAPMREVFAWSYLRSCQEYSEIKQSIGEVDAWRLLTRRQRKAAMGQIIREGLTGPAIEAGLRTFARDQGIEQIDKFVAMTLQDLAFLHEGAIVGLGVTPSQLAHWQGLGHPDPV